MNEIICKAIMEGLYFRGDNGIRKDTQIRYIDFGSGQLSVIAEKGNYLDICYFNRYGKDWAITKEELENE